MAGRGTDIKLGPGWRKSAACTCWRRNATKRGALTGSCAGVVRGKVIRVRRTSLCPEDDLMRLFGAGNIVKYMEKLGLEEGQELEHPLLNRSIGQAQKRVEGHTSRSANARSNTTT